MELLSDDKMVVVDWNNDAIKLIDTANNKIVSEHIPEQYPWGITTCKDTVAATLPRASKIVFLKYASVLVHDREIRVNGHCKGIDCYDDKLYVIYDVQKKLEIMTTTGVVLQTITTTAQGEPLFKNPTYVTTSSVNQRIYVSDIGRLVMLDMDGLQTGPYEDCEFGCPMQLAVDRTGVVFLCDYGHNAVHLLSPAGEKVKILLTEQDGLYCPHSVSYCEKTGRLYVGMRDIIKVYNVY